MAEPVYRNIIMMGPPGGGKGTQSAILAEKLKVRAISTGDLLREAAEAGTKIGLKAKKLIDNGKFVPDSVIIKIVREELKKAEYANGYVLDGFPRTLAQAKSLDRMLEGRLFSRKTKHLKIDLVLLLQVPDDYVIERIIGRSKCAKCGALYHERFKQPQVFGVCDICGGKEFTRRADDTYETVIQRLKTYRRVTAPVIPYYEKKGLLECVDGTGPIDVVSEKIRKIVGY